MSPGVHPFDAMMCPTSDDLTYGWGSYPAFFADPFLAHASHSARAALAAPRAAKTLNPHLSGAHVYFHMAAKMWQQGILTMGEAELSRGRQQVTPEALVASPRSERPPSWFLLWCDERCHKQENEPTRRAFAESMRECSGTFLCRRKALKYAAWLSHTHHPPYVLLTSWREVKPCLEALQEQGGQPRPFLTVVLTESRRVYEKACIWAERMRVDSPQDLILIVEEMEPHALVAQLVREVRLHPCLAEVPPPLGGLAAAPLKAMQQNPGPALHGPPPGLEEFAKPALLSYSPPPHTPPLLPCSWERASV
mmetsp:Transcript_80700/g.261571  ORF Transcript_80700/g.261571 Transcript_80700/m.261571 type:complete len:308 (-) Transcript_80700:174-1097(-)